MRTIKLNIQNLIMLATEHPELPIVALVDGEIVGDALGCRWVGEFGRVELGEFALYDETYFCDRESFLESFYNKNSEKLNEKFHYVPGICEHSVNLGKDTQAQLEENRQNEKELDKYLDEVAERAFKKAILVNIDASDIKDFEESVSV